MVGVKAKCEAESLHQLMNYGPKINYWNEFDTARRIPEDVKPGDLQPFVENERSVTVSSAKGVR
jgi:hypothetical protein